MPKQLNIIVTDEEFEALEKLRKAHPSAPSRQGLARAIFRHALTMKSLTRDLSHLKVGRTYED